MTVVERLKRRKTQASWLANISKVKTAQESSEGLGGVE